MVLKIAILGASGIGKFHAREFNNLGCEIVAILGSSKSTSKKTADNIKKFIGKNVKPYWDLDSLLKEEFLDAVSICTPPETHFSFAKKCLKNKINVFCEKPLTVRNIKQAKELIHLAKKNKVMLTINTQWPIILNKLKVPKKINEFEWASEPGFKKRDLLFDHLAHANSMIVKLIPKGKISDIHFPIISDEKILVNFFYKNIKDGCNVKYEFNFKKDRPRKLIFSINDDKFTRFIGKKYSQQLVSNDKHIKIEDPLAGSIYLFTKSLSGFGNPLINMKEILEMESIQERIFNEYNKLINIKKSTSV